MCGRYQRRSDKRRIAEAFQLGTPDEPDSSVDLGVELGLAPNYNAAPGTMQPVVVWDEAPGMRTLRMMHWRFLPPFCTDPKKLDTIHASAEKLLSSGVWRKSFLYRRCLIPADAFVEWRRVSPKIKLPFVFAMKAGEPFGIAGIWQHWRSPDGATELDTFAVVTVEPNEIVYDMTNHNRMPLLIKRSDYERWLRDDNAQQPPVDLLRPFDSDQMKSWQVSTRINSVRNNDSSLAEPCPDSKTASEADTAQLEMFGGLTDA
ncbi:SOS response-associated peptidase [Acidicapsa acidisoli]|uniref:SOS response-associated peptidase n=1 Tax=Acidicapsa acidisoli TaxID=1615681 RepID=UPI0021DFD617|nr:SOS response-associated peptidase [Acidicapsa acidisoli]